MSTISTGVPTTNPAVVSAPPTRGYRLCGLAVAGGGLVLTGGLAAVAHAFGSPGGSWGGEILAEAIAGLIGYVVAFGPGWWRPRRSRAVQVSARRTAAVLVLLGALLLPICFWNPMPLTFAASAVLLLAWARKAQPSARTADRSERQLAGGAALVVLVQLVVLVVHVVRICGK